MTGESIKQGHDTLGLIALDCMGHISAGMSGIKDEQLLFSGADSGHELFMMDENINSTRGHSCRLLKTRCTRDIVKYFFSNKVISRCNLLDQRTVDAFSINILKSRLAYIRGSQIGFFTD